MKPVFILHGRVVTMQGEKKVKKSAYIAIKDGFIVAINSRKNKLPAEFADKTTIRTKGTIYPGLINLHNHFVYNVLPLWIIPKKYQNKSQ